MAWTGFEFSIPMRGNEARERTYADLTTAPVFDPHEG